MRHKKLKKRLNKRRNPQSTYRWVKKVSSNDAYPYVYSWEKLDNGAQSYKNKKEKRIFLTESFKATYLKVVGYIPAHGSNRGSDRPISFENGVRLGARKKKMKLTPLRLAA